jgi:type II secretory pathway pseudopilin PulG
MNLRPGRLNCIGFTLLEGMVGVGVMGILFVSLYTGMTQGFNVVRLARENLRATQVMQEKFETIRLYNWDQITSTNNFIPSTFTAPIYASTATNVSTANASLYYQGTVTIADSGISETYGTDLKKVTIQLTWNSGNLRRTRNMSSFAARYGLQNYIY